MRTLSQLSPDERSEALFEICERFIGGRSADMIAEAIQKRDISLSREQVYPLLREAFRLGYLQFHAPTHRLLAQRFHDRYGVPAENIHVLNVKGDAALERVAEAAADLALSLIKQLRAGQKDNAEPVHVGFGAGYTTMIAARRLGYRLRTESDVPKLTLHALSSGFLVKDPLLAPVAFFSFFNEACVDVQYVGLFAEAVVPWAGYERVKTIPGVRESFQAAKDVELVITSMASADDETGLLNMFMTYDPKGLKRLQKAGWMGDVQFRPFSRKGAIMVDSGIRAVTVFELADFVKMAQTPNRHVVLVCGPASRSKVSKAPALRCLLEETDLRVWTHLVTDVVTAQKVLERS